MLNTIFSARAADFIGQLADWSLKNWWIIFILIKNMRPKIKQPSIDQLV